MSTYVADDKVLTNGKIDQSYDCEHWDIMLGLCLILDWVIYVHYLIEIQGTPVLLVIIESSVSNRVIQCKDVRLEAVKLVS